MSALAQAAIAYSAVADHFSHLSGKILTVIDASFADPVQRKAVKDLVRAHFQTQVNHIERLIRERSEGAEDLDFILLGNFWPSKEVDADVPLEVIRRGKSDWTPLVERLKTLLHCDASYILPQVKLLIKQRDETVTTRSSKEVKQS